MPKVPIDYKNTVIYKLCCNDLNVKETYIGSTTNFNERKTSHKSCCHNDQAKQYNFKVYKFIRANGGFNNWSMILIEQYICDNKLEKEKRERYWIETLQPQLNINIPTRTFREYYETHKKDINTKNKVYAKQNKAVILDYQKQYREDNKVPNGKYKKQYYESNKEIILKKCKVYGENNKSVIKEREKVYRENNKDKIKAKKAIKMMCTVCNIEVNKDHKSRHEKTKKHKDNEYIAKLKECLLKNLSLKETRKILNINN